MCHFFGTRQGDKALSPTAQTAPENPWANMSPRAYEIMTRAAKAREWDDFWLDMAKHVATRSKDPSTKVGAVITAPDGKNIRSIGYNGFPRGMNDDPSLYADRDVKYSRIVHAEMNAILNAEGRVDGCTLYCTLLPCDRCAVFVVQAGITRVVAPRPDPEIETRWGESFNKTRAIFQEAGVAVVELVSL